MFSDLLAGILDAFTSTLGWIWDLVLWAWDLVGSALSWLMDHAIIAAFSLLPDSAASWLGTDPISTVRSYIGFVSYWVPIGPMFAVILSVLGLVAAVRAGRWIFAMFPLGG